MNFNIYSVYQSVLVLVCEGWYVFERYHHIAEHGVRKHCRVRPPALSPINVASLPYRKLLHDILYLAPFLLHWCSLSVYEEWVFLSVVTSSRGIVFGNSARSISPDRYLSSRHSYRTTYYTFLRDISSYCIGKGTVKPILHGDIKFYIVFEL